MYKPQEKAVELMPHICMYGLCAPLPPTALLAISLLHEFPYQTRDCDKPAGEMAFVGSVLDAST